jgi:hypothetical protein
MQLIFCMDNFFTVRKKTVFILPMLFKTIKPAVLAVGLNVLRLCL